MDSNTVRPSGEMITTVRTFGLSPDSSHPGFPPGIVNSRPEVSDRVRQGFPAAVRNMQLAGLYWLSPPFRETAVPRARLIARRAASGSDDVDGANVDGASDSGVVCSSSSTLMSSGMESGQSSSFGAASNGVCGACSPLGRQLMRGVVMSMSLTATCSPVWRSKHL